MPPSGSSSSTLTKEEALKLRRERRAELATIRRADVEFLKNEGNESFKKGQYEDAVTKYEEAIILGGEKPVLLSNLAAAQLKLARYHDAIGSATTALLHDPKNIKARYRRATARKELKQIPEATADLRIIHSEDPSLVDVKQELEILKQCLRDVGLDSDEEFGSDAEFPTLIHLPYDDVSDSDTSDCLHFGNAKPCRFYNRGECKKGDKCRFSHAPDDMSVRDELGRNVCVYSLISSCMYGPDKCVYSHSREFLPHGWWNHDDDVEKSQQLVLSCAQCLNAPHSLKEIAQQLRVPRLAAGFQRRAYNDLGIRSLDIDREARAKIRAKVRAKAKPMEYEAAATNTTSPSTTRFGTTGNSPFIVVVSLEHEDYYNDILFHLLSSLRAKIQVKQSFKKETALTYLSQPGLAGVYVMDAGIIRKSNSAVLKRLMEYVKDEGGQVCFGGMFPGCINRDEFAEFFKGWGVQWNYGSYHRTTFALNASHPLVSSNSLLLKSYSMKALHVSNISPDVMLYRTTEESRLESFVFAPMKINKPGESPAVAARVGKGWLSFLGDVNGEKGSTGAVMAMLGVLDEIKAPVAVPQEKKPTAVERKDKKEETPPDGKTKGSGAVMGKSKNTEKPPVRQLKEDLVKQDTAPGHFILIIAISAGNSFQDTHKAQLDALQNKVRVEVAVGRHYALQYLSDPNLRGVYVADNSLINFTNSDILEKVVSFAKAGGTVVASGLFPTMTPVERIPEFFGAFDLKWTVGKRRKAEWYLDGRVPLGKWNPSLPETYPVKALAITNLNPKFAVYFPPPEYSDFESPVVRAKVGKGYLGYVGYESPAEPMGTAIILAMFNKLDYTPGPPQRIRKKFVLVLSFDRIEHTREAYSGLLSALANKVEVVHCELSNERIIDLLGSEDLLGVIVMTTDITDPPQAYLLQKLVEFTKGGGTIIFAGFFACDISTLEFMPFFEDNWELPWDMCSYTIEAKLNKNSDFVKSRSRPGQPCQLPAHLELKAVHLTGVKESMIVYKDKYAPRNGEAQAPIAVSQVGKGRLCWLGTISAIDEEQQKVVLAMLGIA